jgi:adenosylcobinamide-phosphate synthase
MDAIAYFVFPLIFGWLLDKWLGDPSWLPHPVVLYGKIIAFGEKLLNRGKSRQLKGAIFAIFLTLSTFILAWAIIWGLRKLNPAASIAVSSLLVFFCLAGKTLITEVKDVFLAVDRSVEEGRMQVARIVGRETSQLNPQQIRTAALETLSENLSDGVIAPLFWFAFLGVPGMLAYKMINTLDSMIGYKSERYRQFGCWAAHIDDVANYVPARLTAFLMVVISGKWPLFSFVKKYARRHASPNSGYPESALAGILNCRFGGPNTYFGQLFDKPYIGENRRDLQLGDMLIAIRVNRGAEATMVLLVLLWELIRVLQVF